MEKNNDLVSIWFESSLTTDIANRLKIAHGFKFPQPCSQEHTDDLVSEQSYSRANQATNLPDDQEIVDDNFSQQCSQDNIDHDVHEQRKKQNLIQQEDDNEIDLLIGDRPMSTIERSTSTTETNYKCDDTFLKELNIKVIATEGHNEMTLRKDKHDTIEQMATKDKSLNSPSDEVQDDPLCLNKYLRFKPCLQKIQVYMLKLDSAHHKVAFTNSPTHELIRLATYKNYPSTSPVFATTLARNGFVYSDTDNTVACNFCQVSITMEEIIREKNPGILHLRKSPVCPLLQGQNCGNIPVPDYDHIEPEREVGAQSNGPGPSLLTEKDAPVPGTNIGQPSQPLGSFPSSSYACNALAGPPSLQDREFGTARVIQSPVESINTSFVAQSESYRNLSSLEMDGPDTIPSSLSSSVENHSESRSDFHQNSAASSLKEEAKPATSGDSPKPQNNGSKNGGKKGKKEKEKKTLTYSDLGIFAEKPKRPDMAPLQKRLQTYEGKWKPDYAQKPEVLADAGMYYAGYADCARCFFCGGGLKNWEPPDCPWVEHARWFAKCSYVRMCKGPLFVEIVQELNRLKQDISLMEVEEEMKKRKKPELLEPPPISTPRNNISVITPVDSVRSRIGGREWSKVQDLGRLEQENEELKVQAQCKICMDIDSCMVFLPCGHLVTCAQCAPAMKLCPLCRSEIKGSVRAQLG